MEEFTILRMGHQGDGIAAGPVFAPVTLPRERVTGKLDEKSAERISRRVQGNWNIRISAGVMQTGIHIEISGNSAFFKRHDYEF